MENCLGILKTITFKGKTIVSTYLTTFGEIGLFCYSTSRSQCLLAPLDTNYIQSEIITNSFKLKASEQGIIMAVNIYAL